MRPKTMTSIELQMSPTTEAFYQQLQTTASSSKLLPHDVLLCKKACKHSPGSCQREADDPTELLDLLNVKSEDHNALYGLRYDAVGESGVLRQEEIEAMSSNPPLHPAVGSFPDAVFIDYVYKLK